MNSKIKFLKFSTLAIFFSLTSYLSSQSAQAGGSLAFSELTQLIRQSKKLSQEVKQA